MNNLILAEQLIKQAEELLKEAVPLEEQLLTVPEFQGTGTVYLIHFAEPLAHANHYIGWTDSICNRLIHHLEGSGARLMQVIKEKGIGWTLARVWEDASRNFERKLKNMKSADTYCPICNGSLELGLIDKAQDVMINCGVSLK